jgi:hypothetical protein
MPQKRRVRGPYKPLLSEKLILAWAEVYYRRHGFWPFEKAGPVEGTETETWAGVSFALYKGTRGLKRRTTLAKLLCEKRKVYSRRPALTQGMILKWAKTHRKRTGRWPCYKDGNVRGAPEENWSALDEALKSGCRGLPGGSSLKKLFGLDVYKMPRLPR